MEDIFNIGIIQHRCLEDRQQNLQTATRLISEAQGTGAQIVCLQELFSGPYFCTVEDHAFFALAEPLNGITVSTMRDLAAKLSVVLVIPFFERRAAGVYHNSAAVIDANGDLLGVYRKMHIPDDPLYYEKFYFAPGDAPAAGDTNSGFQVFKTRYATIGVLICWDQWYPESARLTALLGAEVLFFPTAIGWHPGEKSTFGEKQRAAWQTMHLSHAIANGIYVAAPNRIGHEATPGTDGIEFFGSSLIIDPGGEKVAEGSTNREEILQASCSRKHLEITRQHWPFLRDRRVDAYGGILKRMGY